MPRPCSTTRFPTTEGSGISWVKSSALVLDDHGQPFAQFASAMNMNQLAGIETVAVKNRIVESLPKGESKGGLVAENATGFFDQASQSVYQW